MSGILGFYLFVSNAPIYLHWFFSRVWENWLMVGGTLRRCIRMRFCLWILMYLGHLTKRVKSREGWMSPPRRKFLGFFLKRDPEPAEADAPPFDSTIVLPLAFFTYYQKGTTKAIRNCWIERNGSLVFTIWLKQIRTKGRSSRKIECREGGRYRKIKVGIAAKINSAG